MMVLASTVHATSSTSIDSIAYGSLFALMALSLSLLFGVMGLMNFAYGELIMVGATRCTTPRDYGWLAMILATFAVVIVVRAR